MKNRTFKVSVTLVASLFLNIEAANAGLTQQIKIYIRHGLNDPQMVLFLFGFLFFAFLAYVIAAPVAIGKQKWRGLNYYPYNPSKNTYQARRLMVKKISNILNQHS